MISEVYNRDCMDAMAEMPDKAFDLAIVDPPFGLGEGKRHSTRSGFCKQKNGSSLYVDYLHQEKDWDDSPPNQAYWDEMFRVARKQIVFGENYLLFDQKTESSGRIFWDKLTANDFSDGEVLWTNLFTSVRRVVYLWSGFQQAASITAPSVPQGNKKLNERRIHPTQKPVALYKWLLMNYAKPGDTILDTHLGSGSSRIAAYDLGFDFVGYELDKDYFEAQEKRFADHIAQASLFTPEAVNQVEQEGLFGR